MSSKSTYNGSRSIVDSPRGMLQIVPSLTIVIVYSAGQGIVMKISVFEETLDLILKLTLALK
jgi:hypothetical protein